MLREEILVGNFSFGRFEPIREVFDLRSPLFPIRYGPAEANDTVHKTDLPIKHMNLGITHTHLFISS